MSDQNLEQQQPAGVQLQLSDLLLCAQIISLASSRGAFRAEELSQVGGVFDRVTAFLQESGALQSSSTPSSDQTVSGNQEAASVPSEG